jgi:hypothetical protein
MMTWGISPRKYHVCDLTETTRTARIFQYQNEFVVVTEDCKERHFPINENRFETYSHCISWCKRRNYEHELI